MYELRSRASTTRRNCWAYSGHGSRLNLRATNFVSLVLFLHPLNQQPVRPASRARCYPAGDRLGFRPTATARITR